MLHLRSTLDGWVLNFPKGLGGGAFPLGLTNFLLQNESAYRQVSGKRYEFLTRQKPLAQFPRLPSVLHGWPLPI